MRWITFFIFLYLAAALQTARLGGFPGHNYDVWPRIEYLPLLAVFYAIYAPDTAAPLVALLCGLMYDICQPTPDFIGVNLVPLSITAWLILRVRMSVFREHFISQLLMSLLAVLTFGLLSVIYRKLIGASLEGHSMWKHLGVLAGNAIYTAIIAPFVFAILFRFRNLLGFTDHGPRVRGHG